MPSPRLEPGANCKIEYDVVNNSAYRNISVTKRLRTINPRGCTNAVMAIADLYTVETVQ
jgi:hypothetical protein